MLGRTYHVGTQINSIPTVVAGGLEAAAVALRRDSTEDTELEPQQPFAGFDDSTPDLEHGVNDWKEVRVPQELGGQTIRVTQRGARLFVLIDQDAIPPLAFFMRTQNANGKQSKRSRRIKLFKDAGGCVIVHGEKHATDLAGLLYLLLQRNAGEGRSTPYPIEKLRQWIFYAQTRLPAAYLRPVARDPVRKRPIDPTADPSASSIKRKKARRVSTEVNEAEVERAHENIGGSLLPSRESKRYERLMHKIVRFRREGEVAGARALKAEMERQLTNNPEVQVIARHIAGASMEGLDRLNNLFTLHGHEHTTHQSTKVHTAPIRYRENKDAILSVAEVVWSEVWAVELTVNRQRRL